MLKSKYIKSQLDYGIFKSKNSRKKGTHIIRQKQKRALQKEIKDMN